MYTQRFWVDTETTGLDVKQNFAFEVSYILENGNVLVERILRMRPDNIEQFEFEQGAEEVHGWSEDRIRALPPERVAFDTLLKDLEPFKEKKLTPVGYQTLFDVQFLKAFFARCCGPNQGFFRYFDPMYCDVLQLAQAHRIANRLALPNLELETVCAHFGINHEGAHSSMSDIVATKALFDKLMQIE
jgi:DNA polymerase III epsilon subunit-like protein